MADRVCASFLVCQLVVNTSKVYVYTSQGMRTSGVQESRSVSPQLSMTREIPTSSKSLLSLAI